MSVKEKKKKPQRTKYFKQHDEILNTHIPYGINANASPHIILKHWFHRIKKIATCCCLKMNSNFLEICKCFITSRVEEIMAHLTPLLWCSTKFVQRVLMKHQIRLNLKSWQIQMNV